MRQQMPQREMRHHLGVAHPEIRQVGADRLSERNLLHLHQAQYRRARIGPGRFNLEERVLVDGQ